MMVSSLPQPAIGSKKKTDINEVHNYVDARYVGSPEAMWRIHGFAMSRLYPPVVFNMRKRRKYLKLQQGEYHTHGLF
jgi:hypothetical protein